MRSRRICQDFCTLSGAWQGGHCMPLVSKATTAELVRMLSYPKLKLSDEEQQELLADYLPWCVGVRIPTRRPQRPNAAILLTSRFCNSPSLAGHTTPPVATRIYRV